MKLILRPNSDKSLPFFLFLSFLTTFVVSRFFVYLFPTFYLSKYVSSTNIHVHHFAYGIILMSIIGTISIISTVSPKTRTVLAILFGISLGLAYDEFAMWMQLEDVYHDRQTYDAIATICLVFINLIYFPNFWKKSGKRLWRLFRWPIRQISAKILHRTKTRHKHYDPNST